MTYSDKLRDPRWQRLRLEVMDHVGWKCEHCRNGAATLNVHHKFYVKGRDPWEYELSDLQCLCEDCHEREHQMWEMLKRDGSGQGMSAELLGYLQGTLLRNGEFSAIRREQNRIAFSLEYITGLGRAYGIDWPHPLAKRLGAAHRLTDESMMQLKSELEHRAA